MTGSQRIVETDNPSVVVTAYEKKIAELERQRLLSKKPKSRSGPLHLRRIV